VAPLKDFPPDYIARKVLIAAYIYYVLDDNIMSDERYDRLSRYVVRHWDELHPDRKWCMQDPDETYSSGNHFRFSSACASAALNYYKYKRGIFLTFPVEYPWREAKSGPRKGMAYVTTSDPKPTRVSYEPRPIAPEPKREPYSYRRATRRRSKAR
jgi:hypothetical protein